MKYLLDTCIVLRASEGKISGRLGSLIAAPENTLLVSMSSVWEIVIKQSAGKLDVPDNFIDRLEPNGYTLLPLRMEHMRTCQQLPMLHKDPFDRMIIAQALSEKYRCITSDRIFQQYLPPEQVILEAL